MGRKPKLQCSLEGCVRRLTSVRTVRSVQHCTEFWRAYEDKWGGLPNVNDKICEKCKISALNTTKVRSGRPGNHRWKFGSTVMQVAMNENMETESDPVSEANNNDVIGLENEDVGIDNEVVEAELDGVEDANGHFENEINIQMDESNRVEIENGENINPENNSHLQENTESTSISTTTSQSLRNTQSLLLPDFSVTIRTESKCFICNSNQRHRVPEEARKQVYYDKDIYIPKNNRCCMLHLDPEFDHKRFKTSELLNIQPFSDSASISGQEIVQWLKILKQDAKKMKIPLDFEPHGVEPRHYYDLLGVNRKNFLTLLQYCSSVKASINRSRANALAIFLMKLRLDIPQNIIAILFGVKNQSCISETIDSVSTCLDKVFVKRHLGLDSIKREEAIKVHNRTLFNKLFGVEEDKLIVIMDGTYLYVQKPEDFELQKKTWSGQKKRNLVKPFMMVLSSGHILDCPGPFYADGKNNDAGILDSLTKPGSKIEKYMEPDDVLVLDRGFRDVMGKIEDLGLIIKVPKFMKPNEKQLTTKDANDSRLVTMARWIVECVNGRLKNMFKFFRDVIPGSYHVKIPRFVRIACAIINAFQPPIFTNQPHHERMAERALARAKLSNALKREVQLKKYETAKTYRWNEVVMSEFKDFPKLTIDELKELTMGLYQINMAERYYNKYLNNPNAIQLMKCGDISQLVRSRVSSRFSSSTRHSVWVKFNSEKEGIEAIDSYYCTCKVGARTVGACSHVTCICWYLGFYRHTTEEQRKERRERRLEYLDAGAETASDDDDW